MRDGEAFQRPTLRTDFKTLPAELLAVQQLNPHDLRIYTSTTVMPRHAPPNAVDANAQRRTVERIRCKAPNSRSCEEANAMFLMTRRRSKREAIAIVSIEGHKPFPWSPCASWTGWTGEI